MDGEEDVGVRAGEVADAAEEVDQGGGVEGGVCGGGFVGVEGGGGGGGGVVGGGGFVFLDVVVGTWLDGAEAGFFEVGLESIAFVFDCGGGVPVLIGVSCVGVVALV